MISEFWPVMTRSNTAQSLEVDPDGEVDLEDPVPEGDAELAQELGVLVAAQPVEPVHDSQVPESQPVIEIQDDADVPPEFFMDSQPVPDELAPTGPGSPELFVEEKPPGPPPSPEPGQSVAKPPMAPTMDDAQGMDLETIQAKIAAIKLLIKSGL